mgnify:CR=1 FL=1
MSSHNFISLYFSLELHSLSLISLMFVITFVMVQSYRSNSLDPISYSLSIISLNLVEAALKYFWLSIILSYAILIGIATCYAFTGQTDISKVKIRIIEILVLLSFFQKQIGLIAKQILQKRFYEKWIISNPFISQKNYFCRRILHFQH